MDNINPLRRTQCTTRLPRCTVHTDGCRKVWRGVRARTCVSPLAHRHNITHHHVSFRSQNRRFDNEKRLNSTGSLRCVDRSVPPRWTRSQLTENLCVTDGCPVPLQPLPPSSSPAMYERRSARVRGGVFREPRRR